MDAREQLRRYLEQRRDMGESELVLDTLDVDEALKLIAGSGSPGNATREGGSGKEARDARAAVGGDDGDWRAALRAAGATPAAPAALDAKASGTTSADAVPISPDPVPVSRDGISVGTPTVELFGGSLRSLDSLEAVAKAVA